MIIERDCARDQSRDQPLVRRTGFWRTTGDHGGAKLGAGGQDAVEPEQVKPGRGDEDAELLDQLQRIQQQVRGAVPAGRGNS